MASACEPAVCSNAMLGMRAPQLPRAHYPAVVAATLRAINVVPMMLAACGLAILTFGNQPANRTRKLDAKPCSPVVRVAIDLVIALPMLCSCLTPTITCDG